MDVTDVRNMTNAEFEAARRRFVSDGATPAPAGATIDLGTRLLADNPDHLCVDVRGMADAEYRAAKGAFLRQPT